MAKGKYQRWLEPDGLLLLEGWARDGLTVEQIAHNMGITLDGNTTAQIFWLKNRRPDRWRDKPIEKTSEDMEVKVVIDV